VGGDPPWDACTRGKWPPSRLWPRLSVNLSGAISGTVVALAVIAAADSHRSARVILATTVATLLVFWVARVHAEILSGCTTGTTCGPSWPR
jgi:hypothetical protein